jgi:hypothetical protein
MDTQTANSEVLAALRVIYELGARDIGATESLVSEVLSLREVRTRATTLVLRELGLVQKDRLRLTLAGLVVAAGLPPVMDVEQGIESAA